VRHTEGTAKHKLKKFLNLEGRYTGISHSPPGRYQLRKHRTSTRHKRKATGVLQLGKHSRLKMRGRSKIQIFKLVEKRHTFGCNETRTLLKKRIQASSSKYTLPAANEYSKKKKTKLGGESTSRREKKSGTIRNQESRRKQSSQREMGRNKQGLTTSMRASCRKKIIPHCENETKGATRDRRSKELMSLPGALAKEYKSTIKTDENVGEPMSRITR